MTEPTPLLVNDPNPVVIAIYVTGFLVAFIWNFYAIYKMATLDHVRKEMKLKERLPAQGRDDEEID